MSDCLTWGNTTGMLNASQYTSWGGTSSTMTTASFPTVQSYQYWPDIHVRHEGKSITKKVLHNFPFKKSLDLGLSAQLQGSFDKWAGSIRKEIFNA